MHDVYNLCMCAPLMIKDHQQHLFKCNVISQHQAQELAKNVKYHCVAMQSTEFIAM